MVSVIYNAMTTNQKSNIQEGIKLYLSPVLIVMVSYLLNKQLVSMENRLLKLENNTETIIELRMRTIELERRLGIMENRGTTMAAKHEDFYYLTEKIEYV